MNRPTPARTNAVRDEQEFQDALGAKMANVAALAAAQLTSAPEGGYAIVLHDKRIRYEVAFKDNDFQLEIGTDKGVVATVAADPRTLDGHVVTLREPAGDSLSLDWGRNPEVARTSAEVILEIVSNVQTALAQAIVDARQDQRAA